MKKLSATCIQKSVPTKCQRSICMMHHDAISLNTILVKPGRARGGSLQGAENKITKTLSDLNLSICGQMLSGLMWSDASS